MKWNNRNRTGWTEIKEQKGKHQNGNSIWSKSEQNKGQRAERSLKYKNKRKYQTGLIDYITYELMWIKICDVKSSKVLSQYRFHLFFLPACVWHTNRNVLTIQNSNGAYTHMKILPQSVPLNISTIYICLLLCKQRYSKLSPPYAFFVFFLLQK